MIKTDAGFLNRLRQNDPDAFRTLILEFRERVINTCYRFVRNPQDAEDVAQEVFLEAVRSIANFRGDSSLSTWIYRVAVSKSLDWVRKQRRLKRLDKIRSVFSMENDSIAGSAASDDNPEEELEKKERSALLAFAVSKLTQNQQIAIVLNQYEGLSQAETADIMGITVPAVESLLHRAKLKLRVVLGKVLNDRVRFSSGKQSVKKSIPGRRT